MTPTPPNTDFVRVPTDEYLALQKEVESLRDLLSITIGAGNALNSQLKQAHEALKKAQSALEMASTYVHIEGTDEEEKQLIDAHESIKGCGL